jgi:hypothetical protein
LCYDVKSKRNVNKELITDNTTEERL